MPFERPSFPELNERAQSDIEARLPGSGARLRRSVLGVLARVVAGLAHGLYGYLAWIARQAFPDTADTEHLDRWARIWLEQPRKLAGVATGQVTFTGTSGQTVPAASAVQRADGVRYVTLTAATLVGGVATVSVQAELPGGDANTDTGAVLALAATVSGVSAQVTVGAGGISGGADDETDDELRARVLDRVRNPPQGGAEHDYRKWSLEVAGVSRVWVKSEWMGSAHVGVFFVRDADANFIPDAGEVATLQAHLDSKKPVTAKVHAMAPTPVAIDITLEVTPDTPAVRAAVEAELADIFRREAEPGRTLAIGSLHEAVSAAAGETSHLITVPAGDVPMAESEIAVMGVVTWA